MNFRFRRFLATTTLAVACAAAGSAWAGARDDLKTFTSGLKGLDGQFSQQVFDSRGKVKESTYESGMVPIGDTHKRFNVRFYIVAMIFLVIDVDIIFFYPFATIFAPYVRADHAMSGRMLVELIIFVAALLLAYVYAWGKGVFRWD